ncbi:MAG TPA: hypothetical protein DCG14_04705, partial [Phycisphaerales bacterium]|nr:hypothetical protein [Phycisphaerales bacterium]
MNYRRSSMDRLGITNARTMKNPPVREADRGAFESFESSIQRMVVRSRSVTDQGQAPQTESTRPTSA